MDGPVDVATARVQVDVWADTLKQAKAIAKLIRSVLEPFQGEMPNGPDVRGVWIANRSSNFEPEIRKHRAQTDWMIQRVDD